MALTQITFNDKVENNGATVEGQGRAVDWNEVKTVTNGVIDSLEDTVVKIGSSAGATAFGTNVVAIGNLAGSTSQGDFAVSLGSSAGLNSQQIRSIAIGVQAGRDNQSNDSVAIGREAGKTTMGVGSVSIGQFAGQTTMGADSVAIGNNAGRNSLGDNSVAVGIQAGQNATGNFNTNIGRLSGNASTGQQNTCIGNNAGSNLTTETNTTCLGDNAQVTGSNQVQLGKSTTTTYAYGAVQDRSDERDKADIQDVHLGLDFIEALTPRSYKLDYREDYRENTTETQDVVVGQDEEGNDIIEQQEVFIPDSRQLGDITHDGTHKRNRLHCGLVAQEVKQVMDDLGVDFAGYQDHSLNGGQDVKSIGYSELISPLIKAVQELSARVKVLEG